MSEPAEDRPDHDPRNEEQDAPSSLPGELIDDPRTMPGDQPVDDTPPSPERAKRR